VLVNGSIRVLLPVAVGAASVDWQSVSDLVATMGCNRVNVITTAGTLVFSAHAQTFPEPGAPVKLRAGRLTAFDINERQAVFATDVLDLEGTTGAAS
jgi:hypothetical protein